MSDMSGELTVIFPIAFSNESPDSDAWVIDSYGEGSDELFDVTS